MTLSELSKIVFALLFLFAVAIGLTSIDHPIILKWITGAAKHHGKPIQAKVYANGQLNNEIKVFYTDEANNYLLFFPEDDSSGMLKFINVDLNAKMIERPIIITKEDYDFIAGELFQSETGARFSPFQDDIKGQSFDPQLSVNGEQIKFNLPPDNLKYDSIRIILP